MNEYFDKINEIKIIYSIKQLKEGVKLSYQYFKKYKLDEELFLFAVAELKKMV